MALEHNAGSDCERRSGIQPGAPLNETAKARRSLNESKMDLGALGFMPCIFNPVPAQVDACPGGAADRFIPRLFGRPWGS